MTDIAIEDLISHREPMSFLSRFIKAEGEKAVCEVDITPESAFYEPSLRGVPSYIGIEYIAQTIAAFAGMNARRAQREVKIGFLLGTRKLKLHESLFKLNSTCVIHVEQMYMDESGLAVFDARIDCDEQLMVEGTVNVFQPENTEEFLETK